MGSSSVLVLIGSHSLCNSFVVNQFLFFQTKWRKFPLLYTQEAMRAIWWRKKRIFIFFISKIYSHVTQKWRPKTGIAIPYCLCWKLLHTRRKYSDISIFFAKLQHEKAPESKFQDCWVCLCTTMMVESEHNACFKPVTSWNTRSLPTCTRSMMRTGENTVAINNKALSMPRSEHQSCCIIS